MLRGGCAAQHVIGKSGKAGAILVEDAGQGMREAGILVEIPADGQIWVSDSDEIVGGIIGVAIYSAVLSRDLRDESAGGRGKSEGMTEGALHLAQLTCGVVA